MFYKILFWYKKRSGIIGPPNNISFFYAERLKGTILYSLVAIFWFLLQGFDGYSTLDGFNNGFGLGQPGLALGAVIIAVIALYPFLWQYIGNSSKKIKCMIILIAFVSHLISGVATSRYFMDKLGLGVDFKEREELQEVFENTNREISIELSKLAELHSKSLIMEKMAKDEKETGRYSGNGGGNGDFTKDLLSKLSNSVMDAELSNQCYQSSLEPVRKFKAYNPWEKGISLDNFYILFDEIPDCLRSKIIQPKRITSPSHLEEAIRASVPWSVPEKEVLLAWTGWFMSASLELFVFFLGLMVVMIGKQFRDRKEKLSFEPIAIAAWSVAGAFVASRTTYVHKISTHFYFQTDITTKILAASIKIISAEYAGDDAYHELCIDFNCVSSEHGENKILENISLSDAVYLFWWKALPLLLETGLVYHKESKYFIKAAPFIKWVDVIVSKRDLIGSLESENDLTDKLVENITDDSIGRKYSVHSDFVAEES